MQHGNIDRSCIEPKLIGVALPDCAVTMAELVESAAGNIEHLLAEVEPDSLVDVVREYFKYSSGTGANVDQLANAEILDHGDHGCFDFGIGNMASTHTIPIAGDLFKVRSRDFGPFSTDSSKSPQVALQARIVGVD